MPAGGSVTALTGACAAALLALACGVLVKRGVADGEALRARAAALQSELLLLVDEDADAYDAFLEARREPSAIARMCETPLRVAEACRALDDVAERVSALITGAIGADVRAARRLAAAARAAALELAEANLNAKMDAVAKAELKQRIEELRA